VHPVLVTGATGRVGRAVVAQLLAAAGRGYAARRVGCDDRTPGVCNFDRMRRHRIAGADLSPVVRGSCRGVSGTPGRSRMILHSNAIFDRMGNSTESNEMKIVIGILSVIFLFGGIASCAPDGLRCPRDGVITVDGGR
jgi:nucleoside-diphosphate-sugar epimerase